MSKLEVIRTWIVVQVLFSFCLLVSGACSKKNSIPLFINTWAFTVATEKGWDVLTSGGSALDAIEQGGTECERQHCDHAVGGGGVPDEDGETTLDAMIMDGPTHNVGGVGCLRRIKYPISVARKVLENTGHSLLVGDLATEFAVKMGYGEYNLTDDYSKKSFNDWKNNNCQPNFWMNVKPDPKTSCGPYTPIKTIKTKRSLDDSLRNNLINRYNHDTVGMIAIDVNGNMAVGMTTNGLAHKIPGRVGDAATPGAGAYVEQDVGAAAGSGIGDITMRFLPSYQAVEFLRQGMTPTKAAKKVLQRIIAKYPTVETALIVVTPDGRYGAACVRIPNGTFPFSVVNRRLGSVTVKKVSCFINKTIN